MLKGAVVKKVLSLWVIGACLIPLVSLGGNLKIVVFAVESGDSALIVFPTGKTMLVDTGDEAKCSSHVIPFMERHEITHLDYFLETHDHKDHKEGIAVLEAAGYIDGNTTQWDNNTYKYEDMFTLEGTDWFISNDPSTGGDANTKSTSFVFEYNGFRYSHGADEGTSSMTRMVSEHPEWDPVNVRNTAHHGYGPNNSAHLETLNAELYIVSCNDASKTYSAYKTIEAAAAKVGGDFILTNEALPNGKDGHIFMDITTGLDWEYTTWDRSATIPDFNAPDGVEPPEESYTTLTSPVNGASYSSGETITMSADAFDADGITSVRFWVNPSDATAYSIHSDTSAPYEFSTTLTNGTYEIFARATDGVEKLDSTSVTITVSDAPVIENLIQNPSFETGDASGWAAPAEATIVAENPSHGTYALKLSYTNNTAPVRQVIDLQPNRDYAFTADFNYPAPGTTGSLTARLNVGGVKLKATVGASTPGWAEQEIIFNSGTNTSVILDFYADGGFNGVVLIDNVMLTTGDVVELTGYDAWAAEKGVGAAGENHDGDEKNNLYEYALNGDPKSQADRGVAPSLVRVEGQFMYKHLQVKNDSELVYELKTCSDLSAEDWTALSVSKGTNSFDANYEEVTHTFDPESAQLFMRLEVRTP
jgi:beta-lactamase superfamily II metal-dependent hydrolase